MKNVFTIGTVIAALAGLAGSVSAKQQPRGAPVNPYSRPTVSPYLDLLRQRGSLTENYFGFTRPKLQFQNENRRLQQEITQTRQDTAEAFIRRDVPATGHGTMFLNTGGYFLGRGGQGASRGAANASPPGSSRQSSRGGQGR